MSSDVALSWWWTSHIVRSLCVRALVFWLCIHLFVALITQGTALAFDPVTSFWLVCVSAIIAHLDTRRRGELLMLGNLGAVAWAHVAVWMTVILTLEILVTLGAAAAGSPT